MGGGSKLVLCSLEHQASRLRRFCTQRMVKRVHTGTQCPRRQRGYCQVFREGVWMEVGERGSCPDTLGFVTDGPGGVVTSHPTAGTAGCGGPAPAGPPVVPQGFGPSVITPPPTPTHTDKLPKAAVSSRLGQLPTSGLLTELRESGSDRSPPSWSSLLP